MDGSRPLSLGEILRESLQLYARDWPIYVGVVAAVQAPLGVAIAAVSLSSGLHRLWLADVAVANNSLSTLALLSLLIIVNVLLTVSAVYGSVAQAVHERCSGSTPGFVSSLFFGSRKFLSLLWASLLVGVALVPLSILFFTCIGALIALPAMVFLGTKWLFFAQAIMIEDAGAVRSLRRSWRLVDGLFWRTLGIGLLFTVIPIGLVSVPSNLLGLLLFVPGLPFSLLLLAIIAVNVILTILATPIQMIGLTLAFYDATARKTQAALQ